MAIIECANLRKRYGKFTAVKDLSFTVDEGEIVGFVGPNGAGKTTTMKIMAGLSRPTEGEITLFGGAAGGPGNGAPSNLGYMPDDPAFSSWVTPLAHLEFLGGFFFKDKKEAREKAEESIRLFGLEKLKSRKAGGFSKGERQRLALAHAMTGGPSILVMDEPTSGLDPIGRRQLLDYIDGLKGRTTIIFSTHLLADVETVCDRVLMIDRGRLIADDSIAGLKRRYDSNTLWVEVEGDPGALLRPDQGFRLVREGGLEGFRHRGRVP